MNGVMLKSGKESIFHLRHHWIFSGAVASYPKGYQDGSLIPVFSSNNQLLGYGYFNRKSGLCGRIISFGEDPYLQLERSLLQAIEMRKRFFNDEETDAYRLVNGEGDSLPGLIIDKYGPYLVLQIGTLGMEKLKSRIIDLLTRLLPIKGIYEKSTAPSRKEEGLENNEEILWGDLPDEVIIKEDTLSFELSVKTGQKTGFFLDQREMRRWIGKLACGKRLLNCFSYSGGFTLHALKQGALKVDSVDISAEALALSRRNIALNGFSTEAQGFFQMDVFKFLRENPLDYEIVILDPPAFAKKKRDIESACRGYRDINSIAFKKMLPGSLLLTCSCSYHIDEALFQKLLFQSAHDANRQIRIVSKHRLSADHPINLFHPETDYLKSFLLYLS